MKVFELLHDCLQCGNPLQEYFKKPDGKYEIHY